MEDISKLVQNYTSVFEQCLLAKDPTAHARTLPDSFEKNLLLFLLQPHSEEYKDTLKNKYQIRGSLLEAINKWKTYSKITKAKNTDQIKYIVDRFIKDNKHAYNFAKPAQFHSAADEGKSEQQSLPSTLKPLKPLNQWALEQINRNEDIITSLSKKAIMSISQQRLLKLKTVNKERFLNTNYIKQFPDKFAVQFVKAFYEETLKNNKNYEIPTHILYNLSKSQFMNLKDAIPALINKDEYLKVWFAHSYEELLQPYKKTDLTISQKDEKRKVLLKIMKDLDELKTAKTKSMKRNILKELLLLDISREDVDKQVFLEYIKDNPNSSSFENQKVRQRKYEAKSKKAEYYQQNIDLFVQSTPTNEDQIIKDSLERLFKKDNSSAILKELEQYFEVSLLNKIYAAVKLSEGGKLQDYENYLSPSELKDLKQKRQITILDNNKRKWKVDDEVTLKIKVKNINSIHVQIYKLDLEKHFSQNSSEIDETQNLSYLQPTHSYRYETDKKNPYLVQIFDIKIEGVPKGRGVWIVELEGEGISSRAFIRKGAIANVNTNNTAGTELKFYDESGNQIKDYSIWLDGKRHQAQSSFTIPYGQTDKNASVIVTKDGYAQIFSIYVPREAYFLDVSYIYNTESFIVGSIAKVLIHPRLSLVFDRSMDVSFKLLEKVKILVTMTNNLGIKSTIDFDNVQFKTTEDYLLQFPIQSYTSRIDISISAKVKKYNKKEEQLTSGRSIDIQLNEGNTNFLDLYMKKTKQGGYAVYLLGKNGQPIPRTEVIMSLVADGRISEQTQNLMTSKDGSVFIGDLKEITKVTAKVNLKIGVVFREWTFNQASEVDVLSGTVYLEGQQVVFPSTGTQKCKLWKLLPNSGTYSEDVSDKVVYGDCKVTIKGLSAGQYSIDFGTIDLKSEFTVVHGKVWQNENKIYDEHRQLLYEINPSQNNNFVLGQPSFKNQQNKTVIEIPVKSTYDIKKDQGFRVNLMATNFVVPSFTGQYDITSLRSLRNPKCQTFNTKQSQFYNNKKLAEEASYVINREKEKKYIGNNLQKPKVFLKRIQVRDTTQSQEVLNQQESYNKAMRNQMMRDMMPQACSPYGGKNLRGYSMPSPVSNPLQISTHNNFLSLTGIISSNQKGDIVKFAVPQGYSHFECFAFSKDSGIVKKFDIATQNIEKKNLSHNGISASTKDTAWTMSRQVYKVQKGQNIKVGRDSVWAAVGLSNIAGFAKIKGAMLEDWVTNWTTYSDEEKLKVYDDKVCHQLNAYIKYNDQTFFKNIVEPFIKNKVTKTFVDYCLLDSAEALNWTNLPNFKLLNEFEKVLLVEQLVKANRKDQAQAIATSMENINKSNRITFEQFKRQFDTVITAKLTQQAKRSEVEVKSASGSLKGAVMMKRMAAPKSKAKLMSRAMKQMEQCQMMGQCADDDAFGESDYEARSKFNQPFKQMQKTKQYTQTTYSKLKYAHESKGLVRSSPFWTSIAQYFVNRQGNFLSQNFMYLNSAVEFTLAACFIPNQKLLQYGLTNQGQNVIIEASSSFLIFVREVKSLPYEKKFGVLLNQRFFNPDDRYYYEEDGTRIQKEVDQFIVRRPYCIQTLITNTSGTRLELQLLIDIPEGSVPLKSHEFTQIQSINLEPYSTLSYERFFYFPSIGQFNLYPANACRGGSVIAKSQEIKPIQVLEAETVKKMDTLQNVLKSGETATILDFLKTKNIFDPKIFESSNILWMLKDKTFYTSVIDVLRNRKYFLPEAWLFGYYHGDLEAISEYEKTENLQNHENVLSNIPIFEYFPYYSSRAHKFLNENKSTIRNQQFKKTYFSFLFASLFNEPTSSRSRVAFIYYLLLQDRIDEAHNLLSQVQEGHKQEHRLQFDYIECFIDMYKGYPSFSKARKIAEKYVEYPVKSWQKMFKEIVDTLKEYDSEEMVEESKKVEYTATVLNEGTQLKISIPADTTVEVSLYDVNLELYFSTFPFTELQNFSSNITPNNVKVYQAGQSREEKLVRSTEMKDCFVEVYSSTSGLKKKKISSFLWSNPSIKIKVKQDSGYAQVFYQNKKQAGCYCKVYQMKNGQSKFYRDGYTDITGTFKYALADLQGISEFSILFITEFGGVTQRVKPPSQQAYLS